MSDSERKTLSLPVKAKGRDAPANPRRKPVRGGVLGDKRRIVKVVKAPPDAGPDKLAKEQKTRRQTDPRSAKPYEPLKGNVGRKKSDSSQALRQDGSLQRPKTKKASKGATPGAYHSSQSGGEQLHQSKPQGTVAKPRQSALPKMLPKAPDRHSNKDFRAKAVPDKEAGVRISKLMTERGMCSRREADYYIERGWVFVNGLRVTELGARAESSAIIMLDKAAKAAQQHLLTILLHKPAGYVSGQPELGCQPALSLIMPENQWRASSTAIFHPSQLKGLAPAGRLDADSTGLLVLTQDGRIAKQLIGENSAIDKEYLVRVEGDLSDEGLSMLNHGLSLDGKSLKLAKVEWVNDDQLRFVLVEGRKRQIRRMCELVGLRVAGLKRVRIGKIRLGSLPLGQWRLLHEGEAF